MNVRNFVIIAHIDHGKSTLADRFLELTGTIPARKMRAQYLDRMELEKEKGITIKMQPVRMVWRPPNHAEILNSKFETLNKFQNQNTNTQNDRLGFRISDLEFANSKREFVLNLIDTPGHADFSYEVSRALAAVEGAILLVDATQGIQAQTMAVFHAAREEGLVIIPVINKIDLPSADIPKAEEEICAMLGVAQGDVMKISAKTGEGAAELLAAIVEKIPPPTEKISKYRYMDISNARNGAPLRALVFDSKYDPYLGVVAHIRIVDGTLKKGDRIRCIATDTGAEALEVGIFAPERIQTEILREGKIGYVATGIKEPERVRVGDTLTRHIDMLTYGTIAPLPGYREPGPMVWASIFPENQDEYEALRDGLDKLHLEDAALSFAPESAGVLGRGFRAGFLGLLHMEIIAERIKREYALAVVFSRPSVSFRVIARAGHGLPVGRGGLTKEMFIYGAQMLPEAHLIERIEEPWAALEILAPDEFIGPLTTLIHARGGNVTGTVSRGHERIQISASAPLREIVMDFSDALKSVTRGYASMACEGAGWRPSDAVRLEIMVAGEAVPALSEIVSRSAAYAIARARVEKLKEVIPARLFAISLQASVTGRIIARETIPAMKKDVTGYLYGGDRTRKMKLWKKQQKGKKRLQESARAHIPPEVFLKLLSR